MTRRLFVLFVVTAVAWLIALSDLPVPLRAPAAILALLVLPGHALLDALRLDRQVGWLGRSILTVGGSCAIVVVITIAIGAVDLPLLGGRPLAYAGLATLALTLLLLTVGEARDRLERRITPVSGPDFRVAGASGGPDAAILRRAGHVRRGAGEGVPVVGGVSVALWVCAGLLTTAALSLSTAEQAPQQDVVQLWMLPEPGGARMGVFNGTSVATRYELTIGPGGPADTTLTVEVAAEGRWEELVRFPETWPVDAEITATLSAEGQDEPLRTTKLAPAAGLPAP